MVLQSKKSMQATFLKPTFRSLESRFLDMNTCFFCLFCEMVILAKKRHARRNGRKNRCYSKGSPQHERHTVASPVDRSGINQRKDFNPRYSSCSKKRKTR